MYCAWLYFHFSRKLNDNESRSVVMESDEIIARVAGHNI